MRRILAAVLALWSTLAIVAVFAWSHPAASRTSSAAAGVPVTVVVQGRNGKPQLAQVVVLSTGSASVASTHSSGSAAAAQASTSAAGVVVPASSTQPLAGTRTS
jgi:hypothetical protein